MSKNWDDRMHEHFGNLGMVIGWAVWFVIKLFAGFMLLALVLAGAMEIIELSPLPAVVTGVMLFVAGMFLYFAVLSRLFRRRGKRDDADGQYPPGEA